MKYKTIEKYHGLTNGGIKWLAVSTLIAVLSACGGGSGGGVSGSTDTGEDIADGSVDEVNRDEVADDVNEVDGEDNANEDGEAEQEPSATDIALRAIIDGFDWNTDPLANRSIPDIDTPLAQLGKKLFFSKSLGGEFDSACASCHHPALGGDDDLSLPVGVGAVNPDLLGQGREHVDGIALVPRNSPTNFNVALWDTGLFFDSRVESEGKEDDANGSASSIRTPDVTFGEVDTNAGNNLVAAQARFPVTSVEEMKSVDFENGSDNATIRSHLAARIGNYGVGEGELERNEWLPIFQSTFGSSAEAETLVTFDNIALALGEYQRSLVFIDSPWQNYIDGDLDAMTEQDKNGAIAFFTPVNQGGAGCSSCHSGALLSDGEHHTVAFPQFGPGKGDGNNDDFGRERETGNSDDRYRFRTPSLLNIAQSAPYGHTGAYENLDEVVRHYVNPAGTVEDFFDDGAWCQLEQFEDLENCGSLYTNTEANSAQAIDKLRQERRDGVSEFQSPMLNRQEINELVGFLRALTDPCILDRECVAPWIANDTDDNPDDQVLIAEDEFGNFL